MENKRIIFALRLILAGSFFYACTPVDPEKNQHSSIDSVKTDKNTMSVTFIQPIAKTLYSVGDSVLAEISLSSEDAEYDSIIYYLNGQRIGASGKHISIATNNMVAGQNKISVSVYNDQQQVSASLPFRIKAKDVPKLYSYKVIKEYSHDPDSYTQGLVYEDGFLYEGTGQWGESTLRKTKLETGELIQSYNLPNDVFGEGIVVYKDKIYQLTWQSGVAYEFDKNTFKQINKFALHTEGWGITNYHDKLVMSDGTNSLYVLDPGSFDEIRHIEVYDNVGPVTNLNELEWIDDRIYANVYQTDFIVIINPETGFVEGKINLAGILKNKEKLSRVDVLNGIAYDKKSNRFFVTGKWWPLLFEVVFV